MAETMGDLDQAVPAEPMFTLHISFSARDESHALTRAVQYAEALGILRPEIDFYRAQVSDEDDWSATALVYCREPGPHPMDVCLLRNGHAGRHSGAGHTGSWTDDQIPTAPDTIAEMTAADQDDGDPPDE